MIFSKIPKKWANCRIFIDCCDLTIFFAKNYDSIWQLFLHYYSTKKVTVTWRIFRLCLQSKIELNCSVIGNPDQKLSSEKLPAFSGFDFHVNFSAWRTFSLVSFLSWKLSIVAVVSWASESKAGPSARSARIRAEWVPFQSPNFSAISISAADFWILKTKTESDWECLQWRRLEQHQVRSFPWTYKRWTFWQLFECKCFKKSKMHFGYFTS